MRLCTEVVAVLLTVPILFPAAPAYGAPVMAKTVRVLRLPATLTLVRCTPVTPSAPPRLRVTGCQAYRVVRPYTVASLGLPGTGEADHSR